MLGATKEHTGALGESDMGRLGRGGQGRSSWGGRSERRGRPALGRGPEEGVTVLRAWRRRRARRTGRGGGRAGRGGADHAERCRPRGGFWIVLRAGFEAEH